MTQQTYDASNPAHVERRKLTKRQHEQRRVDDFKALMDMPEGRRFMWWLMEQCHVFTPSFAGAGKNDQTNFNEGQRSVGCMVLSQVHSLASHQYLRMVKDASDGASDLSMMDDNDSGE